jgi:hypothetical protein
MNYFLFMTGLDPKKLHVQFKGTIDPQTFSIPRRYTLTHSDTTGDLFLTISYEYDKDQISGFYTRLMRDEVLAEWVIGSQDRKELHLYLHVSGGFCFGWAGLRDRIFRHHLPLVLKALKMGDKNLFENAQDLEDSPIIVHFQSNKQKYCKDEECGLIREI